MKQFSQWFAKWQSKSSTQPTPGGQVLIKHKGQVLFQENFGYADLEHQILINDDTPFHVASVSKQFTVMAVLLLAEEGLLKLDDPIQNYFPETLKIEERISIRQLCNNVSGLRDQWELFMLAGDRIDDTLTQADALEVIAQQKGLNFPPQSHYMYSNSNFTLLATLVEKLTGQSFNDFLTENIFQPLGMTHSRIKENYYDLIPNRSLSYYDTFQGEFLHHVLNYGTYGATSLHTTAHDLAKWLDNFRTLKIGSADLIKTMLTVPTLTDLQEETSYAGGLFVGQLEGHSYFEHSGVDAGYRAQILSFIEEELDIIILANVSNLAIGQIAFNIARQILDLPITDHQEMYLKEKNTGNISLDFTGVYYYQTKDGSPNLIRIKEAQNQFTIQGEYTDIPLEKIDSSLYRIPYSNQLIDFSTLTLIGAKSQDSLQVLQTCQTTDLPQGQSLGDYYSPELETIYSLVEVAGHIEIRHRRNGQEPLYKISDTRWAFGQLEGYQIEWENQGFKLSASRSRNIQFIKCELPK